MAGGQVNPHPIQLLVNYWEIRPSLMGSHLDRLLREGVSHITSFLPWQAVESDISHSLPRFLEALSERKMTVSLILTPEVGVHFPNSGIPKDLIQRQESMAMDQQKRPLEVTVAPNSFTLPSLLSPEFTKRYYSFLSRMDALFADFERSHGGQPMSWVTLVLTGSFWKYYRPSTSSIRTAFGGIAGDYSNSATLAYRQRLEAMYSQAEFMDPNPLAANRWKTHPLEEINRRWFYQESEAVFRNRTAQFTRKKARNVQLSEVELFTPEADPSLFYSRFLQMVSGGGGDFRRLSSLLDESAVFSSMASQSAAPSYVHWTGLGGFRSLSDSERQFLILKSLLLIGGQGGGVLIDEDEWFSLSRAFRARTENLARSIAHGDLKLRARVLFLAPDLWSSPGALWQEVYTRLGPGARKVASLELLLKDREASLVIVDPSWIMTRDTVTKLTAWAKAGRMVVIPRTALYTEKAKAELQSVLTGTKRFDIALDVAYRIHPMGDGRLVVYDPPENFGSQPARTGAPGPSAWQNFLTALLSIANTHEFCRLSDSRLAVIPMDTRDGNLGIFVLNPTRRRVAADIVFPAKVEVTDLAASLAASAHSGVPREPGDRPVPANRFSLEVPPCGVLPLAVGGLGLHDPLEHNAAEVVSGLNRQNELAAARSELPGIDREEQIEGLWN